MNPEGQEKERFGKDSIWLGICPVTCGSRSNNLGTVGEPTLGQV